MISSALPSREKNVAQTVPPSSHHTTHDRNPPSIRLQTGEDDVLEQKTSNVHDVTTEAQTWVSCQTINVRKTTEQSLGCNKIPRKQLGLHASITTRAYPCHVRDVPSSKRIAAKATNKAYQNTAIYGGFVWFQNRWHRPQDVLSWGFI